MYSPPLFPDLTNTGLAVDPILSQINTPANDTWNLNIYRLDNTQPIPLTFSVSTGTIDTTKTSAGDLNNANALLPSTFTPANITNFWSTINWLYVSLYWTILYDFGQISPTYYPQTFHGNPSIYAQTLPSTNNIFTNPSLFNTYSSFLNTLPGIAAWDIGPFAPLSPSNTLQQINNITFQQNYECQQLRQKSPASVVQAVLIGVYVLVHAVYAALALALGWWYKRGQNGNAHVDGIRANGSKCM